MAAVPLQVKAAAELELRRRRSKKSSTVVGFVHPEKGFTHALTNESGGWQLTQAEPDLYLAAKLEKALTSKKRFIVLIGGRGSSKSIGAADISLIDAKDNQSKTYFLREFQTSIKNSVYSLLKDEIERLEFNGFDAQLNTIKYKGADSFEFAGLARNIASIKSSHGFKRFSIEEAQFLSEESIKELTPTARNMPNKGLPRSIDEIRAEQESGEFDGVQMLFVANPQSSEDPFSKRFIAPFQDSLDKDGFYEDDLHLIIVMNYTDNPWYHESGLEQERKWAYENMSRSLYDHIWLGKYNDSVENSLIDPAWFDACIDAHIKLGFEPNGARIASHDASDEGEDSKGYAMRHGSVILDLQERDDLNVNEGGHWAAGEANKQNIDFYTWDADGLGAALAEQNSQDFKGKPTRLHAFKGSEAPDNPDSIYKPAQGSPVTGQLKNKDVFRNKRAQYYGELRDRIYRTYLAVTDPSQKYQDPDILISFSSNIKLLPKLRAELCRMPIKPNGNGLLELYTKKIMKEKFKFASPNLGDSVMMLMRYIPLNVAKPYIPKPMRPIK